MRTFYKTIGIAIFAAIIVWALKLNHLLVLLAIGTSTFVAFLYRDVFVAFNPRRKPVITAPRIASEFGTVTIETDSLGGTVDILGTIWPAKSDRRLTPGTEIRVVSSAGGNLFIDARVSESI